MLGNPIFVAIGANLPGMAGEPAVETCRWAVSQLASLPALRLQAVSRWYASRPVPDADQPDYVNGAVELHGRVEPADLLGRLHRIEALAGRVRNVRNAARTLDLDIVAMGQWQRSSPDPVLPHPRAHQRAFVLQPLCDLAPQWLHPVLGRTARQLLDALPGGLARVIDLAPGDAAPY